MKRVLLILGFLCVALSSFAQIDTEFWFAAPDLEINHAQEPIRFCIVAYEQGATVVFEQPANQFYNQRTFQLESNGFFVYDVSDIIGMVETQPYNQVLNYGFYIHSDNPVSIYYEADNNNSENYSLKGRNALGLDFVVPMQYTYPNYYTSTCSRIEVVASQDGTEVTFIPSVAIKGGGQAGHPVTVTLNRGQSYAIEAASPEGSDHLRNTRITANKPIAVNSSDDSVNLNGHYDLVGDQIVPTNLLGTDYIAIWNNNSEEYLYIFPTEDNTSIYMNGSDLPVTTLNLGSEYTHRITTPVVYIHADHPIAVFQLSSSSSSEFGGTILPQISCTGSRKTVYKRQSTSNLVVTLIVETAYTDGFVLNGNTTYITASDFTAVPANPEYSYCRKNVTNYVPNNGLLSLENTYSGGFFHLGLLTGDEANTWTYGYFSDYQPYAFAEFQMDDTYCSGQDVMFTYTSESVDNLRLVLPDGTETDLPYVLHNAQSGQSGLYALKGEDCNGVRILDEIDISIGEPTVATFHAEGCTQAVWHGFTFTHSVDTTWTVPGAGQNDCDSIYTLHVTVYPPNDTTLVDATICVGQSYNFHGTLYDQDGQVAYFDTIDNHGCLKVEKLVLTVGEYQTPPVVYQYECYEHGTTPSWTWDKTGITYHEDTTDEIILPDPQGGCDVKHRLDLKFHEEYYHEEYKVACDAYYWPITGETYTESQDPIVKTFQYEFGDKICDSTYVLHLEISNYETNAFTVSDEDNCDSYLWDPEGKEYTTNDEYDPEDHVYTESGTYERTYQNHQGCDSIVTMTVKFGYTPDPTEIYPKDTSNTAPHWVIPVTEFQINSYEFRFWDNNSHCIWESVSWSFESPDVRWLLEPDTVSGKSCKVYVLDYEEDTVWLQATAYNRCAPDGVTQRYWFVCSYYGIEDDLSTDIGNFTVTPNPNNGQMTLNFERMTGRVDVKVYDMTGNLIDHIEIVSEGDSTMHYDLKGRADGIYFFVATSEEGTMVKKVIIKP